MIDITNLVDSVLVLENKNIQRILGEEISPLTQEEMELDLAEDDLEYEACIQFYMDSVGKEFTVSMYFSVEALVALRDQLNKMNLS